MARKLTILTRICGPYISLPDGVDSVLRKTLVPESLRGITDGDEFLDKLENFDGEFDEMRKKATEEGKVIRYVGTVDIQRKLVKTDIETQVFFYCPVLRIFCSPFDLSGLIKLTLWHFQLGLTTLSCFTPKQEAKTTLSLWKEKVLALLVRQRLLLETCSRL
jgi:hypothetical protein